MSDLKTNLQEILQEKQDKIIPENIKKDVQIFDVTGFELDETYENTISPEEYTTAVNTTEQILGEEETVNE